MLAHASPALVALTTRMQHRSHHSAGCRRYATSCRGLQLPISEPIAPRFKRRCNIWLANQY